MATFPNTQVQYSDASPSGRTAAVRGNVDMDIGAGAIARGVQQVGGAMYEVGQKMAKEQKEVQDKLKKAQDLSEISKNERLISDS